MDLFEALNWNEQRKEVEGGTLVAQQRWGQSSLQGGCFVGVPL
jgi:hypothetical protein